MSAQIATSKLSANLDREKMFTNAWWLGYCCCGGNAIGNVGDPFFASEARNLCLHSTCEMTDCAKPNLCEGMNVMCCMTTQCAFPKMDGSPTCVCFNKQLAGGATDAWKPNLFEFKPAFADQFWLSYFLCGGVACNGIQANSRPIIGSQAKQLCIKQATQCVAPIQEGVLCSGLGTSCCFWTQMQFPPAPNNPKFACCGWTLNKYSPSGGAKPAPFAYGKPSQVEMS